MIKKILGLILVAIIVSGCVQKNKIEEISFSSWGSVTEVKILKQVIKDFEKENPKIKINFIHIPQNYFQKIHLLFASNTPPDVLFINNLYLPIYESKLEDLTNLVDKNEFYPQTINGLSYQGKLYGLPRDISNLVLYINLDKIPLPSENWKIEEFLETAQKLSTNNHYGIGCEDDLYWILPYLTYYGGGILDNDGNLIIENDASKKGLNFYTNLVKKYKVAPTKSKIGSSTLAQMFLDEQISMYLSGRWMYPKISEKAEFNWAIINFPYGKSPQPCDVSGWAISKSSKHKESALKFVNYLANEKNATHFAETKLVVPARIKTSEMLNNKEHNQKVFLDVIKHSENTPVNKEYKKLMDKYKIK